MLLLTQQMSAEIIHRRFCLLDVPYHQRCLVHRWQHRQHQLLFGQRYVSIPKQPSSQKHLIKMLKFGGCVIEDHTNQIGGLLQGSFVGRDVAGVCTMMMVLFGRVE